MKRTIKSLLTVFAAALCTPGTPARALDLPVLDDARLVQIHPTYNYGAGETLVVSTTSGSLQYVLINFDLSLLPPNTKSVDVSQVMLYLYVNTLTTPGHFGVYSVTSALWEPVGTNQTTYDEGNKDGATAAAGTVTWNNASTASTTLLLDVDYSSKQVNEYVGVDVTNVVKQWLDNSLVNNGLVLKPTTGAVYIVFDSKENTATGHAPRLEVALSKKRVAAGGDVTMGSYTNGPTP